MSSRKSKQSKEIQIVPASESPDLSTDGDDGLEAPRTIKYEKAVTKPAPVPAPAPVEPTPDPEPEPEVVAKRPKRKMNEKQLAALAAGREKAKASLKAKNDAINEKKKAVRDVEEEYREAKQREFEEKIVRKALSVKKKAIKKEAVLDEISDDDTPAEQIVELKKKTAARKKVVEPEPVPVAPVRQGPKYNFY